MSHTTIGELDVLESKENLLAHVQDLSDWLPEVADTATAETVELTILEWVLTLSPRLFPGSSTETAAAELKQALRERENRMSLLKERATQWEEEWLQQGIEQGVEQGIERGLAAERELLAQLAERKFDLATAQDLSRRIAGVADTKRLAEVGGWIIDCTTGAELRANVHAIRAIPSS